MIVVTGNKANILFFGDANNQKRKKKKISEGGREGWREKGGGREGWIA